MSRPPPAVGQAVHNGAAPAVHSDLALYTSPRRSPAPGSFRVTATVMAPSADRQHRRSTAPGATRLRARRRVSNSGRWYNTVRAITRDGRYVSFLSFATNLVPSDTNGVYDAFVRDRVAGTT